MKTNRMIAVAIFVMMAFTASMAFAASVSLEVVDNEDGIMKMEQQVSSQRVPEASQGLRSQLNRMWR